MKWEGSFDFDRLEGALNDARPKGLMQAGEHIRDVSSELAPKESGDLASSADVRLTDSGEVTVVYPGPYARYQEYGVFWRMRPRPSPSNGKPLRHDNGQSFFLTTPMISEKDKCLDIMADAIREALR
jgi:hypothetical protein